MQRIVPQSASASHSYFPSVQLLLPAPRITGLLPARAGSAFTPQVMSVEKRQLCLDRRRAIWAAQDAKIEAFLAGARQRLSAVCTEVFRESTCRPARPFILEIAS